MLPVNLIKEMSYTVIQFIFSPLSLTRKLVLIIDPLSLVGGTSGCNVH